MLLQGWDFGRIMGETAFTQNRRNFFQPEPKHSERKSCFRSRCLHTSSLTRADRSTAGARHQHWPDESTRDLRKARFKNICAHFLFSQRSSYFRMSGFVQHESRIERNGSNHSPLKGVIVEVDHSQAIQKGSILGGRKRHKGRHGRHISQGHLGA